MNLNLGLLNVSLWVIRLLTKGYQCFDPVHNKMYTTMDCEFFEESYYFSKLGPQGESVSNDLS